MLLCIILLCVVICGGIIEIFIRNRKQKKKEIDIKKIEINKPESPKYNSNLDKKRLNRNDKNNGMVTQVYLYDSENQRYLNDIIYNDTTYCDDFIPSYDCDEIKHNNSSDIDNYSHSNDCNVNHSSSHSNDYSSSYDSHSSSYSNDYSHSSCDSNSYDSGSYDSGSSDCGGSWD